MTVNQISKKLESMKGRSYEYAKQIHTVQSYAVDEETFSIRTDKNNFKRKHESADEFFKFWYETPENKVVDKALEKVKEPESPEVMAILNKENSLADDLVDILKHNIDQLKKNPGYINQAKAINNNVNSILNIQKLKLEMVKHMKGK